MSLGFHASLRGHCLKTPFISCRHLFWCCVRIRIRYDDNEKEEEDEDEEEEDDEEATMISLMILDDDPLYNDTLLLRYSDILNP